MTYRFPLVSILFSCFVAATLTSCGGADDPLEPTVTVYPVEGQVLYKEKPAPLARVTFHPVEGSDELQKLRPTARADEQGKFQLNTFGLRDGAPEGKYKVTVEWRGPDPGSDLGKIHFDDLSQYPNRLAEKYSNPESSPLTVTVTAGQNNLKPLQVD